MKDKIKRFQKDPRGIISRKLEYYRLKFYSAYSTAATRMLCTLRDIHLGKDCLFYGVPIFRRAPQGRITIGNKCIFRSDLSSNLVGLNRKCIIATHKEKAEIRIGDNSGFSGTVVGAAGSIQIGCNVKCGANVLITDFDWHNINPDARNEPVTSFKPVVIEDNVWLGLNAVVLKGVHVGTNSVIGVNSVVVSDIPDNVVAAGNPCKVIKHIFDIES